MDERVEQELRKMAPDSGADPIRVRIVLPPRAQLLGRIDGEFVNLTKVYQGPHVIEYLVGDRSFRQEIKRHSVEYGGRLSKDGQSLEGKWMIGPRHGRADGSFVLRRV